MPRPQMAQHRPLRSSDVEPGSIAGASPLLSALESLPPNGLDWSHLQAFEAVVAQGGPGFVAATSVLDYVEITTFHSNGESVGSSPVFTLPPVPE